MTISVDARSGLHAFECAADEPLLFAGLRQGLNLPYECGTGTCGTCRGRVIAGVVATAWETAPGFARLRRDKGDVLLCQARASGDCTVKVPADIASPSARHPRPAWCGGRIARFRMLTHDVAEFYVSLPAPVRFEAGQFVVIEADGVAGGRAYSMVDGDSPAERFRLVIKRKPGGGFSDWIFDANRDGTGLRVFGPLGRATFDAGEDRDVVCIAGGSGIAGMVAIVQRAVACGHFARRHGRVFFGVRTLADGFYLEEFSKLVDRAGARLEVLLALSHETPAASRHPQYPNIQLAGGFVHEVALRAILAQPPEQNAADCTAFLAGPTPMVDAALRALTSAAKVPRDRIRYDKFT